MTCVFYLQFSSAGEWIRRQLIHCLHWGTLLLKHRYYRRGTGPTLRHESNYENKPAQLSQLRTLHNASFDKCLEVLVALNCGWADDKQIWLFLQNAEEGWEEWARVAHKGVIPVMWPKQSELTRPCSYTQPDFFLFLRGTNRAPPGRNGLGRKWDLSLVPALACLIIHIVTGLTSNTPGL